MKPEDLKIFSEMLEKLLNIGDDADKKENCCKKDEEKYPYVLVRADRAGVFVGNLFLKNGTEVVLRNCRRLWYWDGAASISQLAIDGTSKPGKCKFPEEVSHQCILGVIEILPVSEKAKKSIKEVPVWRE